MAEIPRAMIEELGKVVNRNGRPVFATRYRSQLFGLGLLVHLGPGSRTTDLPTRLGVALWHVYERERRVRARNLVARLRERAAHVVTAVEGGRSIWPRRRGMDWSWREQLMLVYSERLSERANKIEAKYLKEGDK